MSSAREVERRFCQASRSKGIQGEHQRGDEFSPAAGDRLLKWLYNLPEFAFLPTPMHSLLTRKRLAGYLRSCGLLLPRSITGDPVPRGYLHVTFTAHERRSGVRLVRLVIIGPYVLLGGRNG